MKRFDFPAVEDYIRDVRLPGPCRHFCGRKRELDALHKEITEHGIVFVCGLPGIGKSELAKAYAKAYGKEYNNILYLSCSGDLKRDIAAIIAADDLPSDSEKDRFRKHDRFLRTLREDSLLIIDNFSAAAGQSRDPSPLLPYRCRILVTTRYYLPERTENAPGCRWTRIPQYRKGGLPCLNTPTRSRTPFRSPNRIDIRSGK